MEENSITKRSEGRMWHDPGTGFSRVAFEMCREKHEFRYAAVGSAMKGTMYLADDVQAARRRQIYQRLLRIGNIVNFDLK